MKPARFLLRPTLQQSCCHDSDVQDQHQGFEKRVFIPTLVSLTTVLRPSTCLIGSSGVARGGFGGSNPLQLCIFYCLVNEVIEQKQWLSLQLFNSIQRMLSDDVNGHSGIKETRVCDCVTINYCDAADIYGLPMYINVNTVKVICYRLDSLSVN